MRKLILLSIVSSLSFATEKQEEVPYIENGKIVGTKKLSVTRDTGKTIKSGQPIVKFKSNGFKIAALANGANNPFGLLQSDVLLEADGEKMTSLGAAQEFLVNSAKYKSVKVMRDGQEIFLTKKE